MCGRTTSTMPRDTLADLLRVDEVDTPELPLSWNVAPTQPLYVAVTGSDGCRKLSGLRWGLVPSWAKDPRIGSKLINARAETVTEKAAYREPVRFHRGLAAFSGFYEWRRPDGGGKGSRQPFYFSGADGRALVFAVLWDVWRDAEGRPLRSCSIVTTSANRVMMSIHHRMPVILQPEDWDEWLRPIPLSPNRLRELPVPAPDDILDAHPVSMAVNSALNNGPELIEPVDLAAVARQAAPRLWHGG